MIKNDLYRYGFGELKSFKNSNGGGLDSLGNGGYSYATTISYKPLNANEKYIHGLPVEMKVTDGANPSKLYRHVRAYYTDNNCPSQPTRISQIINEQGDSSVTTLKYDRAGNITNKVLPSGMAYTYTYDDRYKMYVTQVKDTFGYVSKLENYDYRFGIPLKTTDFTGSVSTTTLDNLGRVVTITGPNEYDAGNPAKHTIKFQYYPDKVTKNTDGTINNPAYAVTRHYDPTHPADSIVTVTFVDGFGRAVQVKKDAVVDGAAKMIVSGRVKYDAFGRPVRSYYPMVDELSNSTVFKRDSDAYKTLTSYDVLDRVTQTILPDNSRTKMEYAIVNGLLRTRVTDANNKYQDTYATGDGKTVKTVQYKTFTNNEGSDPLTTLFEYDAINQPVKVTDDAGKTTVSVYDLAGRRTKVTHPASGETRFRYDVAGNMISKKTANLLLTGDSILYVYNFNRLTEIKYPDHPENNVKYVYGTANDVIKTRRGRLVYQEDGSGGQEFSYGKMGELTELRRTLVIPNQAVATYVTQWQYDSWNRLLSMTYPDGEVVNYTYNTGGMLTGVASTANTYVSSIKYDKFEQRTQLTYANGAVTNYTYKPENRLLGTLSVVSNNTTLMNNAYTYDAVNNVTKIVNTGAVVNTTTGTIGGSITHNYFYDNLYRLDSANGQFIAGAKKANYGLRMRYDNMHNIVYKKQDIVQQGVQFAGVLNAGYELFYTINANNSQQISNIADASYRVDRGANGTYQLGKQTGDDVTVRSEDYGYDANGNLIYVLKGTRKPDSTLQVINSRKLLWDEENRLLGINDNGFVSNYWYDAAGERTVKQSYDNEGVQVNGALSAARTGTSKFTAYISPYLVVSNGGNYTKHIYMGSQRITSKVSNSGIFKPEDNPVNTTEQQAKLTAQTSKIKERFDTLGVTYSGIAKTGGLVSLTPLQGQGVYFYHSDHLGSSSLITDITGALVQHVEYVPFGETFLEERNGNWHTPYLFNAKERDEETGLYYYHARYYDSKRSVWLSVDPLAEKYFGWSSYVYCHNNPVKYTDPTGMSPYYNSEGKHLGNDEKGFKGNIYITTQEVFDANSKNRVANSKTIQADKNTKEFFEYRFKLKNSSIDKIFNHIAAGTVTPDGKKLSANEIKLVYDPNLSQRIKRLANAYADGKIDGIFVMSHNISDFEWTVENIRANVIHEIWGHIINGWEGDYVKDNTHYKCYQAEMDSRYWEGTTERFKKHSTFEYSKYLFYSSKNKWKKMPNKYRIILNKILK